MKHLIRIRVVLAALVFGPVAQAQNWPQYRGPAASGLDRAVALPTTWNMEKGENIRWQTPIPGLAHAAPIVWGDRIYVATAVSESPAISALSASICASSARRRAAT